MKEHINFICKTAFLEIRRMTTIHHYLTADATKTLVVSLVLSRIDFCNSLLAGLPKSLVGKLQRVQNCAALLVVRTSLHVHVTPILRHLHWLPVRAQFPIRLRVSVSTPSTPPPLLISLTYICTRLLDLFAPVLTLASSKFHSISAKQKVILLSLTLVLLSGTHCHCILEMQQLSTPTALKTCIFNLKEADQHISA